MWGREIGDPLPVTLHGLGGGGEFGGGRRVGHGTSVVHGSLWETIGTR
jgi:hypothetical protein